MVISWNSELLMSPLRTDMVLIWYIHVKHPVEQTNFRKLLMTDSGGSVWAQHHAVWIFRLGG